MLFVKPSGKLKAFAHDGPSGWLPTFRLLAGPLEDIPIDRESKLLDYEGELCVRHGQTCKNLDKSDQDPLDFRPRLYSWQRCICTSLAEYAVVRRPAWLCQRIWQVCPNWPIDCLDFGHSRSVQAATTTRYMESWGRRRELTTLLFEHSYCDPPHVAVGGTIRPGTVIMTGTPSGVGWFMEPSGLLKDWRHRRGWDRPNWRHKE